MTERGLPPEGAPACPFVAFEDDRDGRSTAPDHRHRCFAEPRPAPRALAHQEAYCLASAFPVCPTFQDWARREAAAARPAAPGTGPARDEPPQSRPMPPLEREPRHATDTPPPIPPRRTSQRNWAAPPPWSAEDGGRGGLDATGAAAGMAAAGSAGFAGDAGPDLDPGSVRDEGHPPDAAPPPTDWGSESRGLAGSAAYRLAGPDPDEPPAAVPDRARSSGPPRDGAGPAPPPRPTHDLDRDDDLEWAAGAGAGAYVAGAATARDQSRYAPPPRRAPEPSRGQPPEPRAAGRDQVRRPERQEAQELFGPAWEPARRYEAYPSLKTRVGLPGGRGISRLAMWGLLLVAAAVFVFVFGPRLLGLVGGDDLAGGATPTPVASEAPTDSPEPTVPPAPTPQVYIVERGDTMSKIAARFGVTVEEIMAANPQIRNPNRIDIGDEITIPVPEEDGFEDGAVDGESAEP
jgi:LysM repeat protein